MLVERFLDQTPHDDISAELKEVIITHTLVEVLCYRMFQKAQHVDT